MVVQGYGGKGTDEDAVLLVLRHLFGQYGIQRMVALQYDDVTLADAYAAVLVDTLAQLEVVARQLHLLACQQLVHLLVEQRGIHGLYTLEVVVAVGILGRVHTVHEVVVRTDDVRTHAGCHEQDGQTLAGGGLSAGRGTGQEHQFGAFLHDVVHYLVQFLFLKGLAHVYQLRSMPVLDGLVELTGIAHPKDVLPTVELLNDVVHFLLGHHLLQFFRILARRDTQEQALEELLHAEEVQLACPRQEAGVEVVHRIAQAVVVGIEVALALQKPCLAFHSLGAEQVYGLLYGALHAVYLLVHGHYLLHALLYGHGILLRHLPAYAQFAEVTAAHRRTYYQLPSGVEVLHGFGKHQEESQRVCPHAVRGRDVLELHILGIVEAVVHALHLVVHKGAHGAMLHVQTAHFIQFLQTCPERHFDYLPVIAASYSQSLWHSVYNVLHTKIQKKLNLLAFHCPMFI